MINRSRAMNLLQGIQFKDPKLFEVLRELILAQEAQANPVDLEQKVTTLAGTVTPDKPTGLSVSFTKRNTIIKWTNATPGTVRFFDLRYGTDWDTADQLLVSGSTQAVFEPLEIGPTHTYLLKSIDLNGIYSDSAAELSFEVPPIGAINLSSSVIDNNVLLRWSAPTSVYQIANYIVRKNGAEIGVTDGTFIAIFESAGGTYTYSIVPVDIAGNEGPESFTDVIVNQPTDFEVQDVDVDDLTGSRTNLVKDGLKLVGPIDEAHTWEEHFEQGPWDNINEIIAAGYTHWLQPSTASGEYVQTFDFGVVLEDTLITIAWATLEISGIVAVTSTLEFSEDGSTWDTPITGTSAFVPAVRYVRLTLDVVPTDDTGLIEIFDITLTASLKRELDSGDIIADESDVTGTDVAFNKPFKDIDSITLTVESIEPIIAIYDFLDVPNPTGFKILVYDGYGNRITYPVSWKARGII